MNQVRVKLRMANKRSIMVRATGSYETVKELWLGQFFKLDAHRPRSRCIDVQFIGNVKKPENFPSTATIAP